MIRIDLMSVRLGMSGDAVPRRKGDWPRRREGAKARCLEVQLQSAANYFRRAARGFHQRRFRKRPGIAAGTTSLRLCVAAAKDLIGHDCLIRATKRSNR